MSLRRLLRMTGKVFMAAGALIILFVAYQLWGTGVVESRAQHRLLHDFATRGAAPAPANAPPTTMALPPGGAVAVIDIPKAGVHAAVVEGVGVDDLEKGPGHYPGTPLPGQPGNVAIAGHRTTYGAPFYHLDTLAPGDPIEVRTRQGQFHYTVVSSVAVSPTDVAVIAPTPDNRLTLTTCTPRFSARQRLIVVSSLDTPAANRSPGTEARAPAAESGGLSGKGSSTLPAILWGLACLAIWAGAGVAGRKWRLWASYLIAAPFFVVALYAFFGNFARFVPANF